MAAISVLDPGGTAAPMVGVRLTEADVARIVRLARRRRTTRSALLRAAIRTALDRLEEADTGPPGDGGG